LAARNLSPSPLGWHRLVLIFFKLRAVPTSIPSISTFSDPSLVSVFDPALNPSKAAAYWLRRDIVRGVFAPIERLKVEHLVKFYRIGHSPIREAIILLSSSGLVVHEHQKGYRAAPVSLADYDDVLGVYQRLYRLALDMAMEKGDDAWEERIVVQLHRSVKVPKVLPDGDPEARERRQRAYGDLHAQLLSGCGSMLIMQLIQDIGGRLERYVNLFADLESDRNRDMHAEHRKMAETIVSRDRPRVHTLVDNYFAVGQPVRVTIKEALKRGEEGSSRRRRSAAKSALPAAKAAE
jgi:GntR family transcriptional regulator, carbon starvation induced regulator